MNGLRWLRFYPGDEVTAFLIVATLGVALMSGLALIASLPLQRRPAVRHSILLTGLICTLLIPLFVFAFQFTSFSIYRIPAPFLQTAKSLRLSPAIGQISPSHQRPLDPSENVSPTIALHKFDQTERIADDCSIDAGQPSTQSDSRSPKSSSTNAIADIENQQLTWFVACMTLIFSIWLAGSSRELLRYLLSSIRLSLIRYRVRPLSDSDFRMARFEAMLTLSRVDLPQIGISDHVRVPMVAGMFRPLIMLPASMLDSVTEAEIHDILVHETAHVARGDLWVVHLEALALVAFWPIPFVRLIASELSKVREEICDIYVLKTRPRCDYGNTLLQIARLAGRIESVELATAILQRPSRLEQRISNLLTQNRDESTRSSVPLAFGIALSFLALAGIASSAKLFAKSSITVAPESTVAEFDRHGNDDQERVATSHREQRSIAIIDHPPRDEISAQCTGDDHDNTNHVSASNVTEVDASHVTAAEQSQLSPDTPKGQSGPPQFPASASEASPTEVHADDPFQQTLDHAIEVTSKRYLTATGSNPHSPWQIFHCILALRNETVLKSGSEKINAIQWLSTTEPKFAGEPWLLLTPHGAKFHPYTQKYYFEGHPGQFLALLSQSNLPLDYKFHIQGKIVTLNDLINNSMKEVNPKEEVTWVLWALQHCLKTDAVWQNKDNETWSIERLVQMESDAPVVGAPCGGNHRLFALTRARDKHLQSGGKLRGAWLQADRKIKQHIELARSLQNPDGSFSSESYKGKGLTNDVNSRFNTTGHTMEFLAIGLPPERLDEQWVRNAVWTLSTELIKHRNTQIDCGPLFHSLNALILYRERIQSVPQKS